MNIRKPLDDMNVFVERRQSYKEYLLEQNDKSALLLAASSLTTRNSDVTHSFRQESNFYYMTGFEEPDAIFMILPYNDAKVVMFVNQKDPLAETWTGFRYGIEGAKSNFLIDAVHSIEDFETLAVKYLEGYKSLFYRMNMNDKMDNQVCTVLEKIKALGGRSGAALISIKDSFEQLGEMRVIKSNYEIEQLKKSCEITGNAHISLMRQTKPGMSEMELRGLFLYECAKEGSPCEGYESIVASGNNATCLHYNFNDQPLNDGGLLLVDAGGEYHYYSADITRTYPVNGKFTKPQKELYQKVLELQKSLVESVKPGGSFKQLNDQARRGLTQIMLEVGLLMGDLDKLVESGAYKKYYPHGVGHWLGMDVHDRGLYQINNEPRQFEAGMCFTIEPGIYVPADDKKAPEKYRGIGIRIEDDILVTRDGHINMTGHVPKEISELEEIIGKT